jgi:hypothetical protein
LLCKHTFLKLILAFPGRIAFAPIYEKCNLSFAPQGYISFAPKNKNFQLRHFPGNIYVNVDKSFKAR